MGRCAGPPRLGRAHRRRRRPRRHASYPGWPSTRPSRRPGPRCDDALAGADLVDRREPLLAAAQPAGGGRRGGGLRRGRPAVLHHHDLPWQRPHLAHLPPAARRPGMGARHDQRAQPRRAGGARASTRHDDLQRVRPRSGARRPGAVRAPRSACADGTRAAAAADARARPARTSRAPSRWPRPSAAPTGCSARPRTATAPSSTGWSARARCPRRPRPARGRLLHRRRVRRLRRRRAARRPGRVSATRRWSRRRTAARWPSARYPVAAELAAFGFRWFDAADPAPLARWLRATRTTDLLAHNHRVAAEHFNLADLPGAAVPGPGAGPRPPDLRMTVR